MNVLQRSSFRNLAVGSWRILMPIYCDCLLIQLWFVAYHELQRTESDIHIYHCHSETEK